METFLEFLYDNGIEAVFTILVGIFTYKMTRKTSLQTKLGEFEAAEKKILNVTLLQKTGELEAMQQMKDEIAEVAGRQKEVENRLNVEMQNKISYGTAQRDAIIGYVKGVNELLGKVGNSPIAKFRKKITPEIHTMYSTYHVADSQLLLYTENNNIRENVINIRTNIGAILRTIQFETEEQTITDELKTFTDQIDTALSSLMPEFQNILRLQHGIKAVNPQPVDK